MAEAAKALGLGPALEFRGKRYQLSPWTLEMSALFEVWLEQRAWDAAERCRGAVPEATYQRRVEAVAKLIASGHFAFGSQAAADAALSLPGRKYGHYLQLKMGNPGEDVSERLVEDLYAEQQALFQLDRKSEEANRDVGPPAAAAGSAGA